MGTHHAHGHHHHHHGDGDPYHGHGHSHENLAPRVPLLLAAGLVLVTALGVAWQQLVVNPGAESAPAVVVVAEQHLQFLDAPNGVVEVIELPSGERIDVIGPGEGSFVRSTLRGLVRDRRLKGASMVPGFSVQRLADGAPILTDLATGTTVYLRAFG
ncbi:MAG: photosynthetic complex assembly protein PuhC, partial [Pseudomonadota bacterium]